jgi:hypothetical protein
MSKVKTYGIHGVVERVIAARLGKATMNITFSGGIMDSSGVRPATFTTNKVVEQYVVENHPMFKNGSIKVISEIDLEPKEETAKTEKVEEVKTLQQARQFLMDMGVPMEELQSKAKVLEVAKDKGITFPNL